jgi:hypothetical protein
MAICLIGIVRGFYFTRNDPCNTLFASERLRPIMHADRDHHEDGSQSRDNEKPRNAANDKSKTDELYNQGNEVHF